MKISDLIEIKPPSRGFRNYYEASIAGISGSPAMRGKTKEEAIEKMVAWLKELIDRLFKRYYLIAKDGTVFCLYYTYGWQYDIARNGQAVPGGCALSTPSEKEARTAMESHFHQYNADIRDPSPEEALTALADRVEADGDLLFQSDNQAAQKLFKKAGIIREAIERLKEVH